MKPTISIQDDFELINNDTAPNSANEDGSVLKSPRSETDIIKDQVHILKTQNNAKMKQLELQMEEKLEDIKRKFNTQKLKLQLQQDAMESRQKVSSKKVMDILNDQKQQLYGINAFVEDCFNDLQAKYAVEKSIYDAKMSSLSSDVLDMNTRVSKLEVLLQSKENFDTKGEEKEPDKNLSSLHSKARKNNSYSEVSNPGSVNLIDLDCKTICVKTVHDQSFQVSIGSNATILEVKGFINEILSIPVDQQILVGNGKVCNDREEVHEEIVLYLIVSK